MSTLTTREPIEAPAGPVGVDARALPAPAPAPWRAMVAVVVAGFCTFLQMYPTQPLLPYFQKIFGASELKVSLTVTAATVAVALASPVIGILADALGRKRVIVPAILGLAVPTALAATSTSLNQLIAWRFAQGLFIPGVVAVTMAYIAEEAPPRMAGRLMSAYVTGTVFGGFCGRFLTAIAAEHMGWRWAFVALAAMTLVGGVVTWLCLPRSRRFIRHAEPAALVRAMLGHLSNKRVLATCLVGFNVLFSLVGIFTYVNFHLAAPPFGLGTVALGSIFMVYLLGMVVTPLAGRWIDRFGYRRAFAGAVLASAAGTALTLVPATWAVVAGLAVLSSGVFVSQSAASSHIGAAVTGARSAAAGLYVFFYYLGGSAAAPVLGLLWPGGGWTACVLAVAVLQVITALVALRYWLP